MSIVDSPLTHDEAGSASGPAVRAMHIGQHVIAIALTAIGATRAAADGTPIPVAVICAIAILAWHTAGTLLPARIRSRGIVIGWLVGFALLWIIAVFISAEFVWLAFLLWLLAGHLLPGWWAILFSVLVFAVVAIAPIAHHGSTSYANVFGPLIGGVFALGISRGYLELLRDAEERERLVTSLAHAQRETESLQNELAVAQRHSGAIEERTRLSRDIHDTIAQSLSSIRLLAHSEGEQPRGDDGAQALRRIAELAGDGLGDVRRIVAALAPSELDANALASALDRLLEAAAAETGILTELHVDESLPQLSTAAEVALLRTAQSALANVHLHARASRVVMSLIDAGDSVRLDILDNGQGFDRGAWEASTAGSETGPQSSFGLNFMRDRLRELGGGLDIETTPGDGTALSAHLPFGVPRTIEVAPGPGGPPPQEGPRQ